MLLEWYGKYDVAVRKEGYETLKTERWVVAPWWQWPPIDLVAELLPLPLRDRRRLSFELEPAGEADEGVLDRAAAMRAGMQRLKVVRFWRAAGGANRASNARGAAKAAWCQTCSTWNSPPKWCASGTASA